MSYIRVLPRDLFNEAALLKCLGKLWILVNENQCDASFPTEQVDTFRIEQDPASGGISVANVEFAVRERRFVLLRPLNARSSWSFYLLSWETDPDFVEIEVFDEDGNPTDDFKEFIHLVTE